MATQCRSSKCTAERKGFRRELDSWRHKLIHCVGFESILEGIYGPRLLQDLNIFDECEPEAADDWSVDANCSFCNLQLEKLNDHPALVVAGSPPSSETPPPQGLSTSEKLQCQADRFLHAIFHKKEIPQRCDPSIPLVAQELMRKMVRRFAFEYACKSQAHEDMSDDSEPFPHQTDPDGPLDLTVSRASQALPQDVDGVLDLSKKNTSAQDRGFLGTIEEDQSRPKKDDGSKTPEILKATVLDKVLSSLCSRHRTLLYYILKDVREEHFKITVIVRDTHGQKLKTRSLSCHADRKLLSDPPSHALSDCTVSDDVCRMAACKCPSCTFSPFCVYLCSVHGHSFQNTALACADKVMCCNSTVCPAQSKLPLCQHQKICQSKGATVVPQEECKRSCSPPPSLSSLQPVDCKVSVLHSEDSKTQNQTSPTLLPHRTEVEDEFTTLQTEQYAAIACPQTEKEIEPPVGLVNGVTENLESLSENEDILASQMFNTTNDAHLTDKNCNHNELLEQPMGDPITKKGVKGDDPPMRDEREIQPQHPGFKDSSSFDEPEYLQVTGNGQLVKIKDDTQYSPTVGRSRRHIVPPQRFSSYVTEPRKMYFAACFSERIFTKISPKDDQITTLGLNEETALQSSANDVNALRVTPQNIDVVDEISSQKCNGHDDAYDESVKDGNSSNIISHSQTCCTFNSPTTNSSNPPETDAAQCSELKYDSPIKLMFFSSVKGENGVKYKLKAAASCSNSHEEAFDPFVESSWQSSAERVSLSAILNPAESNLSSPKKVTQSDPSLHTTSNLGSEPQETAITHQKRGPGRPRKIGPHNVKLEKRPIGRPPKPKLTDLSVGTSKVKSNTENSKTQPHSENDRNKNIQVTILYGRSRGIKRVVSEGVGLGSALSHTGKDNMTSRNCSGKEFGCKTDLMTRQSFKDLSFVMPVEEKKCISSSSIIKCEKQNDQAVSKRPGRPAKVKISGISVTVSTASPKQRKICLKRDTKDERKEPSRTFLEFQPLKEQNATHLPTVVHKAIVDAPKECNRKSRGQLPVRHSVRERKPSIHLLHSVATARSCALIRRSRKLLLNKASCEASHLSQNRQVEPSNLAISPMANVRCVEDLDKVSAISLDPIFSPNECTKWWLTSASPNTLNKEFARKIRVISNTWVSEMVEPKRSEVKTRLESKRCFECPTKKPISSIKKLFEKNYDTEKLCTWFMQTTETQALGIVKKARARNSKDVFHYNPSRPNCRANLCPSPQAERLRKHMKKFAKVIPKTPAMHKEEQEGLFQTNKLKSKRRLFTIPVKVKRNNRQPKSSWILYRATLLRAKRKFSKTEMAQRAGEVETDLFRKCSPATQDLSKEMHLIDEPHLVKVQNALNLVQSPQRMGFPKENQIGSKAWSPESLTECRVFLKKINSPGTKSSTEDCDLCTVKLYDDSETEVGMTGSSPVPLAAFSPSPRESRRKRGKWKSSTSSSPPAKMLRQSRSSRGVLGARWCDFVLGSLK